MHCSSPHRRTVPAAQLKRTRSWRSQPPGSCHRGSSRCCAGLGKTFTFPAARELHFPAWSLPNAAAVTRSGNQAASRTSTNFFTPSLPTVTGVIYCLLPSPLPSVQPRRAAHVNRCHLSEGRSRAPAPFYNASLLMLQ